MYNEYQQILQRSVFYVDRIAKCEIGGGPLSLLKEGTNFNGNVILKF